MLKSTVSGNIWIGIGAVSVYLAAQAILFNDVNFSYLALLFSSTVFSYLLHRLGKPHLKTFHIVIGLFFGSLSLLYFIFHFELNSVLYLIIPTVITTNYLISRQIDTYSIRKHAWLKPISIAFTWSWCALGPNWLDSPSYEHVIIFLMIFCQILSLAIIFDVKDKSLDHAEGISTLAQKFSLPQLKTLCISIALCAFALMVIYSISYSLPISLFLWFSKIYILQIIVISLTTSNRDSLYYYIYIDGIIVLSGLYPALHIFIINT